METTKKQRGRPKKSDEDRRTEKLYLKLTPYEKGLLRVAFADLSVDTRTLLLDEARRRIRRRKR